jgi:hypothetical protein
VAVLAGAVAVPMGLVPAALAPTPVEAAGCRTALPVLSSAPRSTFALPGGASVRIWDTGARGSIYRELRLAVVKIPKGTLTPGVAVAPTISTAATPSAMARRDPRTVVVVNGGHFNPDIPGIPQKIQVTNGVLLKGYTVLDTNLATYAGSKQVWMVRGGISGSVRSARGTLRVTALNWQVLPPSGVTVYSYAWGRRPHPAGPRTVVVSHGTVVALLGAAASSRRPTTSQQFVTAPAGSYATALMRLRVGDKVSVSVAPAGTLMYDGRWPHNPIGKPTGILGSGGTLVRDGVNKADCTTRNEILRPRSAVAWTKNGDLLVVTVSGRLSSSDDRYAGASVRQFAEYLRRLGAVTAANLDCGTSTELLVRTRVGGPFVRLDRSMRQYERPITDVMTWRAA